MKKPKQKITNKVSKIFDPDKLKHRCKQTIDELFSEIVDIGGEVVGKFGNQYAYLDNKADILVVAHLDVVLDAPHFEVVKLTDETLIYNTKLDDRLGVYTILDMLPKLGVKADILFTENEEIGRSTASDFISEKQYNWVVEFDRTGTGYVSYSYDFSAPSKFLKHNIGSISDICYLEHLGCKAFNVGVAYYDEHSNRCYMSLDEYLDQISLFISFYNKYKTEKFEHVEVPYQTGGRFDWRKYYGVCDTVRDYFCITCNTYLGYDDIVIGTNYEETCRYCRNKVEVTY